MLRGASFCPLILRCIAPRSYDMKPTSHILGYLLAAVIALTAQSAAVARTMPDAAGQMVLCTGTGPVMIYFDEQGEPTGAPHLCPDFTLSLIIALDGVEFTFGADGVWQSQQKIGLLQRALVLKLDGPNARAPPVLI